MSTNENPVNEEIVKIDVHPLMGRVLSEMEIPMGPAGLGSGWQLHIEEDDKGKKHVFAVLALSDGNGVHFYWFGVNQMIEHANQAQQVVQRLLMEHQKLNPLLVASSADANRITKNGASPVNRNPGQPIDWPPKDWKN